MPELIVPVVNLNGNTCNDLVDQLRAAYEAVAAARGLVGVCEWSHGRNFQTDPRGDAAGHIARQQKSDIIYKLNDIHDQLLNLALAILQQGER